MISFTKLFVALMAASAAAAAPSKRQYALTTCEFVLIPDTTVSTSTIDINTEFNYVIGRSLGTQVPNTSIWGSTISIVDNGNNTFNVVRTSGVTGKTAAQTAAYLTGLIGTTTNGFANGAAINWTFDSIVCDA